MKTCLVLLHLILCTVCFAQTEIEIPKTQPKPFIEVTGTAIKEVVPDKIYISIILSDKVVNNQTYTITAQEKKLKEALTKNNVDLSGLFLSNAASEITTYRSHETGFKVTKEYTLLVPNAAQISTVFKELYAINIKEASITKVERSDIDILRKQVRIAAIQAAKDKAEYLLKAIDEEVGKPLEIHEQNEMPFFLESALANANTTVRSNEQSGEGSEQTDFQKMTIKFSYYIKYSIK